jgi:hypothetical protein
MTEAHNNQSINAWDSIQLIEKTIEPDKTTSPFFANRNMQLGNITAKDYPFLVHRHERGMDLLSFPNDRNGWMYRKYGQDILQKNDAALLLSGSKEGFVRQLMKTSTQVQRMKDETQRGLSYIMGKKE